MIPGWADVTVLDREGRPVLMAEARSRFDTSSPWAIGTFRNLYAHGSIPDVPYFLLALPDVFHLWRDPARKALEAYAEGRMTALGELQVEPDYSVPAWKIVSPYLGVSRGRYPNHPNDVSGYAMEMALGAFVAEVLNARDLTRANAPSELWWLFDSGLYEALRGGTFAGTVKV